MSAQLFPWPSRLAEEERLAALGWTRDEILADRVERAALICDGNGLDITATRPSTLPELVPALSGAPP